MRAFLVLAIADPAPLAAKVMSIYPGSHLVLSDSAWLVADTNVTTQEICGKLNIGPTGSNNAIVVKIDGYFGMASPSVWEWLRAKGTDASV